ncbi:integrator complex subunit 15-like [Halichondria panicea]|uniref:integrator complex subunit 15-like n=1 Tax=Halichondria panicea TaxID=6063 RepID=UPI00312BB169
MRFHPTEAAALVKTLYHDFCVLLPDAYGPLLQLPTTSPHFAQQLALSFTSLHSFYSVTKTTMDSSQPNPPIRILQIVYHWLSTYPNLLSPPPLLNKEISELPLVHSNSINFDSEFPKPVLQCLLPGLMQWCVLAPLCPNYPTIAKKTKSRSNYSKDSRDEPMDTSSSKSLDDKDMQMILTSLHADLLSSILSLSKPVTCQMSGKEMAMLIANLLGYYSHRKQRGEEEMAEKMEECVERLAQLLQISLSSGLLNLRPDDVSGLASTLPKNRLLQLVIARAQQQI